MALYRITLELTAPLGTPLAGPTLFGQMCWLRREADGEQALADWLADPARIWRVSDGFPHDCLPRPLCHPRPGAPFDPDHKERKRRPFVTRAAWLEHRAAWDDSRVPLGALRADATRMRRLAHNVVDRHGRGTLEEGGLFFADEDWRFAEPASRRADLYVEAPAPLEEVRALLAELGEAGYGRDASTGRGRWRIAGAEVDEALASGPGSRRMVLTRGILTPATMHDALWRVEPHFGRTGPQLALSGTSPFKHPVLLIRPGASFSPAADTPHGPFGGWITGVHPDRPEVGLNGLHIAIPFAEAGQAGTDTTEDAA